MSVLKLPEPDAWNSSDRRLMWVTLGTVVAFSPAVYCGVRALMRGHYLTVFAMACLVACPVIALLAVHQVQQGHSALRATFDSTGTTVRSDRRFSVLMIVVLAVAISGFLVIALFVPTGGLDIPMSEGMRTSSSIVAWFGVFVGLVGLLSTWRRGGVGWIKLTPGGIDIANIAYTESVNWSDVTDVKASAETKKSRKAVVLGLPDNEEKIIDGADFYVPRGAGLYWMVRQYMRNPDQRPELTDGTALERLRDGRFDCE